MALAKIVGLAGRREPLQRVLADRLQQPVAHAAPSSRRRPGTSRPATSAGRGSPRSSPSPQQTSSAASSVQPPANTASRRNSTARRHRADRGSSRPRPQGLLARQRRPRPAGQQPEAVVEPGGDPLDAEHANTAAASSIASGIPSVAGRSAAIAGALRRHGEARAHLRARSTKRRTASYSVSASTRLGSGRAVERQRGHAPVSLAGHPERLPARRQHGDVGQACSSARPPRRRPRAGARSCRGRPALGRGQVGDRRVQRGLARERLDPDGAREPRRRRPGRPAGPARSTRRHRGNDPAARRPPGRPAASCRNRPARSWSTAAWRRAPPPPRLARARAR